MGAGVSGSTRSKASSRLACEQRPAVGSDRHAVHSTRARVARQLQAAFQVRDGVRCPWCRRPCELLRLPCVPAGSAGRCRCHICTGTWLRICRICTATGLTSPTSAPELPLPHPPHGLQTIRASYSAVPLRTVSLASRAVHRTGGIRHRSCMCAPSGPARLRLAPTSRAGLCRSVFTCAPFGPATPGTHSLAAGSGPVECHGARSARPVPSEASLHKCLRRLLLLLMPALLERQRSSAAAAPERLACARSLTHIFWPAGTCAVAVSMCRERLVHHARLGACAGAAC